MKAEVNIASKTRQLLSIALQMEAKATLVMFKQKMMSFPNACEKWVSKQEVFGRDQACGNCRQNL